VISYLPPVPLPSGTILGEISNIMWWEDTKNLGSQPGLESIEVLLDLLGSPQNMFKSIHVTGTNGKGSTSAMAASILRASGYSVGLFTSPHLSSWTESIVVDGKKITEDEMSAVLGKVRVKAGELLSLGVRHPTHFEVLVAACFLYFKERGIEYAVIEVGMGGRDDATNVIPSNVSVLTNISLEHTAWLGDTVEKIAEVKSGILREGTALVTASILPEVIEVLEKITHEKNSNLIRIGVDYIPIPSKIDLSCQTFHISTPTGMINDLEIPLLGVHQVLNASCALAAIQQLNDQKISEDYIRAGLQSVVWPGRFEIIEKTPIVILDGAKDARAAQRLTETVKTVLPGLDLFTVISTSSDKDFDAMIRSLADITGRFIITEHRVKSRTATTEQIEEAVKKTGVPYEIVIPVHKAIDAAKSYALEEDAVLVTGSVFLVGEAREYWYPPHSMSSG
jgi:dihydrofolate synthase/folylpolyglutamate synthase